MTDRNAGGADHPIEDWTDDELIDQLRYVRAEFSEMDIDTDDDTSPESTLIEEIERRGLDVPDGKDLDTPGRADSG